MCCSNVFINDIELGRVYFGKHFRVKLFRVNNRNTRKRCKTCSKSLIMIPKRRYFYIHFQGVQQRRRSSAFSVNFEHISYLLLVFRLLALNIIFVYWVGRKHVHSELNNIT